MKVVCKLCKTKICDCPTNAESAKESGKEVNYYYYYIFKDSY